MIPCEHTDELPVQEHDEKDDYRCFIGTKVCKFREGQEPKPFKSGRKMNTVKDVIDHPILNMPAFTFDEDDSYVECRRCYPVSV